MQIISECTSDQVTAFTVCKYFSHYSIEIATCISHGLTYLKLKFDSSNKHCIQCVCEAGAVRCSLFSLN